MMEVWRVADVEAGRERAVEDDDAVDKHEDRCQCGRDCFMIFVEVETNFAKLQMRL